jgi:serine/threonine protein kinase
MSTQDGGRILGEGVYGCAFDTPLKCKNPTKTKIIKSKNTELVGKITSIYNAQHEFTIAQQLAKIPDSHNYFALIQELCTPLPRSKQEEPDLKKCQFIEDQSLPNISQITMPFAGRPLRVIPKTAKQIDFLALGQQLLEAGTLLLLAKIVHRDIHFMNILMDSHKHARIIDFGLAWQPDAISLANLDSLFLKFEPRFTQEPPEVTCVNGYNERVPKHLILSRIADEKQVLTLKERVFGIPKWQQMEELKHFLFTSESIRTRNAYAFYKLYWSKFDAWSIGAILLTVYTELTFDPQFEKTPSIKKRIQGLLTIIKGLCSMDPAHRLDCAEALAIWAPESSILKRKEVKEWLEEQSKIRAQL